jgi:endonuclease/exonuclease/phosphatase family metal-dependent hydrolase
MRFLVYNIAYGTGSPNKGAYERLFTVHRYIKTSSSHLDRIIEFIKESKADIVGLVEVDTGSYRTNFMNQVETVANHLKHYHHSSIKYGKRSLGRALPILNKQANAILTKEKAPVINYHYFPRGFKKLIIEVDVRGVRFFLVHLSLQKRIRRMQLEHLSGIVKTDGPMIIAGDFNALSGPDELEDFQTELGLVNPNKKNIPTYPSWNPKKQLDFILCTKEIKIKKFEAPEVRFSDHLPLILDFDI